MKVESDGEEFDGRKVLWFCDPYQMLRSGTAIGALLKEAEHAQSKADFISKVNIALKEANETEYWIMLLKETDYLSEKEYESIIEDCRELIKLTVSIVKTSKQNMNGTSK